MRSPDMKSSEPLMESKENDPAEQTRRVAKSTASSRLGCLATFLGALVVLLSIHTAYLTHHVQGLQRSFLSPITGISQQRVKMWEGYRVSQYQSYDEEEADAAWGAIEQGHGIVALDTQWARSVGLPPADTVARDPSKSFYSVAVYHSLHCVVALRELIKDVSQGYNMTFEDRRHAYHCLDNLREEIMCNADDTPVIAFKNHKHPFGFRQHRMCRDWTPIREWAMKYTTCYASSTQRKPGQKAFDRCDGGDDGIIMPHQTTNA